VSHEVLQQVGSMPQTLSQHASSSQAPVEWGTSQEPASGSPQVPGPPVLQLNPARMAQVVSQAESQQNASMVHTVSQQVSSSQAGVPLAIEQGPLTAAPHRPMQSWLASCTQSKSHASAQQIGSTAHTVVQQSTSSQPPTNAGSRHEPPFPHDWAWSHGPKTRAIAEARARMWR
jgi:hypothetical protein